MNEPGEREAEMDGGTTTPGPNDSPAHREGGRSAEVATMEWGPDEAPRHSRLAGFFRSLGQDPRIPAAIAGIGAVALFVALTDDWVVITLPHSGPEGESMVVPRDVSELGNVAAVYLLGTLALLGCLALVLFGAIGIRHNARMFGLAMAGGTGGALLAITTSMDRASQSLFIEPREDIGVAGDRGLAMAYVATVAFTVALLLAAPRTRPVPVERDSDSSGWSWRHPRPGRQAPDQRESEDDDPPPPADLTVLPAPPFTQPDPPFTRPGPRTSPERPDRSSWSAPGEHS